MREMTFDNEELGYFSNHGRISLHIASWKGHLEIIKYLVEKEADVNAKNDFFERRMILFFKSSRNPSSLCI